LKKIFKNLITVLLILTLLLSLFSCDIQRVDRTKRKFRFFSQSYFATEGALYDYTGSPQSDFDALCKRVESELLYYHRLYDIYNEYEGINNLATVNRLAGEGSVKVAKEIIDLLIFARDCYEITLGHTNIALGAVLKIWHEYRDKGVSVPTYGELSLAAQHISFDSILIDEKNCTVEILDGEASIDVGAVAKGYAVEMISKGLLEDGYSGYVLDVGGNLRIIGSRPSGSSYTVSIKNPDPLATDYAHTINVDTGAVVTSGSYQNFYIVDGVSYHHIIDKDTLFPSRLYQSVTVVSDSSALSDALSTAFFCMTREEISKTVASLDGVRVIIIDTDGRVSEIS
jgi:thiamine biosynthesis lipoprotein